MLVSDHEELVSDHEELVSDPEVLVSDHEELVSDHEELVSDHEELVSDHEELVSDHEELVSDHEELVSDHEELVPWSCWVKSSVHEVTTPIIKIQCRLTSVLIFFQLQHVSMLVDDIKEQRQQIEALTPEKGLSRSRTYLRCRSPTSRQQVCRVPHLSTSYLDPSVFYSDWTWARLTWLRDSKT